VSEKNVTASDCINNDRIMWLIPIF